MFVLQVKFTIDKDSAKSPWMSGGPLQAHGMYVFQDLHVHWGFRNILGGEHKVDNRRYMPCILDQHILLYMVWRYIHERNYFHLPY